jgi:hypothetical protein
MELDSSENGDDDVLNEDWIVYRMVRSRHLRVLCCVDDPAG